MHSWIMVFVEIDYTLTNIWVKFYGLLTACKLDVPSYDKISMYLQVCIGELHSFSLPLLAD